MKKNTALAVALMCGFAALPGPASARNPAMQADSAKVQADQKKAAAKPAGKTPSWKKGSRYTGKGSVVSDYRGHGLSAPAKGGQWVKDGSSYLLIDKASGKISSIRQGR